MAKKVVKRVTDNKIVHEIELLPSRALIALKGYLDFPVNNDTHAAMIKLFKDYKQHKDALRSAIQNGFVYLVQDRYKKFPDDPPSLPDPPPKPSKERVTEAKRYINQIAKKFLKK
jgi:hypothetical protein